MYLLENPVLQRELLVNLRMKRGFVLMLVYQALLAAIVYVAWPQGERLDLSARSEDARQLVDMFFLGQYVLASLMAPSFAAGAITGEKERKTYEMLLASPLRPAAIVLGKAIASLAYLAVLIFSSLPIIMLCLPLGGVSPYEVFAAYLGLHRVGDHVRRDRDCLQQLLPAHGRLAGRVVPGDSAAGHGGHSVLVLARNWGEFRLLLTATVVPGPPRPSASRCSSTPARACCIRPTWAARATKWWIWNRKPSMSSDW